MFAAAIQRNFSAHYSAIFAAVLAATPSKLLAFRLASLDSRTQDACRCVIIRRYLRGPMRNRGTAPLVSIVPQELRFTLDVTIEAFDGKAVNDDAPFGVSLTQGTSYVKKFDLPSEDAELTIEMADGLKK